MARALCILFLPFWNENADIHEKDVCELVASNSELIKKNQAKFESNNFITDMIDAMENAEEEGSEEDEEEDLELETTEKYQIEEMEAEYDRNKAKESLPKDDTSIQESPEELRQGIIQLNEEQRAVFDEIMERIFSDEIVENPFYNFLAGEAGVGKSFLSRLLIRAIKSIKIRSGQDLDKPLVLTMAPTANAAFLVGGKTIESALNINMSRFGGFTPGPADKMAELSFLYEDVSLILINEVSMLGTKKLAAVNYRLQQIATGTNKDKFMGGKSCLAVGDLRQLPPVLDEYIFEKCRADGRPALAPSHWNENFEISYLTQKMRCSNDLEFANICDRVGKNAINSEDEEFFNSRVISSEIELEKSNSNFKTGEVTIIVTTNHAREKINLEKLRSLLPNEKEYTCLSKDNSINKKNFDSSSTQSCSYSKTKV